jgi:hypothetical protein
VQTSDRRYLAEDSMEQHRRHDRCAGYIGLLHLHLHLGTDHHRGTPIPLRTYSGTGDDVVRLDKPPGIALVSFSCPACTSNTIYGLDVTLVHVIGSYTGKRWLDETSNGLTTQLTIKAHGRWTLTVGGLDQARRVNGPVSGHGDDVILLDRNTTTATVTNRGNSNFVVHNIDSGGEINLLINEIGGYRGTVPLRAPSIVEVQSSGDWTLAPR